MSASSLAATPFAPNASDPIVDGIPTRVSFMCPAGFTSYCAEGMTLDRPLFARVTYTPDRNDRVVRPAACCPSTAA